MNILYQWSESHYEGALTRRRFSIQTEKLQITISSIILKIFTAGSDLSRRRREGAKRRQVISCCTVRVHFPDGLSSLLPDLVCVVLHGQVIGVGARAAVVPLHPFKHITQICVSLSHCLFYILSRAPSHGLGRGLVFFFKRSRLASMRAALASREDLFGHFCVCLSRAHRYNYLSTRVRSSAAVARASPRPGDDISGIMSIFCAHFKPPPPGNNDQRVTCHSLVPECALMKCRNHAKRVQLCF